VALVVALGTLLVLSVVAAAVAASTLMVKQQTTHDRARVMALADAESALRLATYDLNQAMPISDGQCPSVAANGTVTRTAATNGQCGPYSAPMPSGATTTFVISPGGVSPLPCAGAQVTAPTRPGLSIHQRCITSTAAVRGATRRIQIRVASVNYIFPIPGIVGTHNVRIGQGAGSTYSLSQCSSPNSLPNGTGLVMASVGTNGTVTTALGCWLGDTSDGTTGVNTSRLYLGPNTPATNNGAPNPSLTGAQPGGVIRMTAPLSLPTLTPLFQAGADGVSDTSLPAANNNALGIHTVASSCTGTPYNATTRVLDLGNNGCSVTLDGSTDVAHPSIYNFCGINLPNNGILSVTNPSAAPYLQVYVDSTVRKRADGSAACTTGTGTVTMGNGASILNNATTSLGAQIFIWGTGDPDGSAGNHISWRNGADVKMLLVAPHAEIDFQNGGRITGGIAAYDVTANNNMQFIWDESVDKVERGALFYRVSYTECSSAPLIPTDPHSGC